MLYGPTQKKHLIFKLVSQLQNNKKVLASTDIYSTPVYTPLLVRFIKEKIIENDNFFKLKIKNNLINYSSNHYISIYSLVKVFAKILKKEKTNIGYRKINSSNSISKISVVGVGMRSHAGVAQTLFATLGKNKINIQVITTSEIKISNLIDEKFSDIAVQKLHQAFKLYK